MEWLKNLNSMFVSKIAKKFIEMHHTHYIIHYLYGLTWYKIMIPRERSPMIIEDILDCNGDSVKDEILPFMGPGHNFHGITTTPGSLGHDHLTFTFLDLNSDNLAADSLTRCFERDDPILL